MKKKNHSRPKRKSFSLNVTVNIFQSHLNDEKFPLKKFVSRSHKKEDFSFSRFGVPSEKSRLESIFLVMGLSDICLQNFRKIILSCENC